MTPRLTIAVIGTGLALMLATGEGAAYAAASEPGAQPPAPIEAVPAQPGTPPGDGPVETAPTEQLTRPLTDSVDSVPAHPVVPEKQVAG